MKGNLHRQRITTWIAIFAVLLASLAPSVSHALAASGWTGYLNEAERCSEGDEHASGHAAPMHEHDVHASHEAPASQSSADHALHFEHCPFCFTHAGSFGTAPTAEFVTPLISGSAVLPLLFFHSPHPLFSWAAPQARAPPAFS
ncbi:MAG: DUF2946 domain-containing protein [Burkholderiaceae bacterium]